MNWTEENNKINKDFEFDNFTQAINFVNKIAQLAEEANHHPDILIHDYKQVKISLSTHSENKVTDKDRELADKIDKLV